MEAINWTKGIDQKTGLPIDYDPTKDIQVYSGLQNQTMTERTKRLCPSREGGANYQPTSYSQRTKLLYIPSRPTCNEMTMTPDQLRNTTTGAMLGGGIRLLDRTESEIVVADPFTGAVKNRVRAPYPNFSAALTTAGGLLLTGLGDGTFVAYDDTSLEPLWKINVGAGINAPPMTFEAGGKQFVTVMTGLSRVSKGRITLTPELNFNFIRDIAPVAGMISEPLVMVVNLSFRPRRFQSSSPIPRPIRASSTWRRRAPAPPLM
jgi:alcohol dehydrogenase (cytochrome c)